MLTVMIVEDDLVNSYLLSSFLKDHFRIILAPDGYKMQELLATYTPDVVLLDLNLGDERLDGMGCLEIIRKNEKFKNTAVYAVTTFASEKDREFFISKGFNGLFLKPVDKKPVLAELFRLAGHAGKFEY